MKLLKDRLEKFIFGRMLIGLASLALLDLIFLQQRWAALAGLILGGILGLTRFLSSSAALRQALSVTNQTKLAPVLSIIIRYAAGQTLIVVILAASLVVNPWLFMGCAAGILLIPFIIFINGLTEGLGITNNKFD